MSFERLVKEWDPFLASLLPGSSPLHRAAIWGQTPQESGCKPDAISPDGGHGLLQWTGPRWNQLAAYAMGLGKPWTDIETQIRFLVHELTTTEAHAWAQTQKTTSPEAAAETFMLDFERPAKATANLSRRVADTFTALGVIQAAQPGAQTVVDNPPIPIPASTDEQVNQIAEWIIQQEIPVEQLIRAWAVANKVPGFAVDAAFSFLNPVFNGLIRQVNIEKIGQAAAVKFNAWIQGFVDQHNH